MSPSRPFILRPVATTLLMAAIVLVGVVAYRFLPVSALPEVEYPTIQVQTFYPGASPEVVTSSITAPLEARAEVLAGFFLGAYIGLSAPVVALGVATEHFTARNVMLVFVVLAAVAIAAGTRAVLQHQGDSQS